MENQTAEKPLLVSIETACEILDLSRTTIHALLKSGVLTSIKFGRATRIRRDQIEKLATTGAALADVEGAQ